MISRRSLIGWGSAALAAGATALGRTGRALGAAQPTPESSPPSARSDRPVAVVTPNGSTLPFRTVGYTKVFHLVAERLRHQIAPGLTIDAWGYNGSTPGPTIEATEGDHVRIYVTNRLPEPTTVHWHGIKLPNGMDGVAGVTQPGIPPGETFKYEFTFLAPGTYMYHPHFDEMVQMAFGMVGMIVVHPRTPSSSPPDRDYALMLSEWRVTPGTSRPNPNEMTDFNVFTINSRAFPATAPIVAQVGERVRIRFGNLSAMSHHPMHLHGYSFMIVGTDGGPIAPSAQWPETTVLVPVGSTRDIELVANAPGDWPLHCHMTHHVMNQMGHNIPNMLGVQPGNLDQDVRQLVPGYMTMGEHGMGNMGEMRMPVPENSIPMRGGPGPFGYIDMGGLFTILKVREHLDGNGDPGWYAHPPGTVAAKASAAELRADGVTVEKRS
jgi:FtsP/CotA-like multicopper oxidase with cupredoxin domain